MVSNTHKKSSSLGKVFGCFSKLETPEYDPEDQEISETKCIDQLVEFCKQESIALTNDRIFQFACFHHFNLKKACDAIWKYHDSHYLYLRLQNGLLGQMYQKILFPLQGLRTRNGATVMYSRPSRYTPSEKNSVLFLENIAYVLSQLTKTEQDARSGVVWLVNFADFNKKNKDKDNSFIRVLNGEIVPIKITQVLFVDAPQTFKGLFKLLKPLMAKPSSKRLKYVRYEELGEYFDEGFEEFLPDDFPTGWKNTAELVDDFVDKRLFEEKEHDI